MTAACNVTGHLPMHGATAEAACRSQQAGCILTTPFLPCQLSCYTATSLGLFCEAAFRPQQTKPQQFRAQRLRRPLAGTLLNGHTVWGRLPHPTHPISTGKDSVIYCFTIASTFEVLRAIKNTFFWEKKKISSKEVLY